MKALVADPSKTMRTIIRGVLSQMGAREIEDATDGHDALSKVKSFQPDLIVVDRHMPNTDGLAFVKMYRSQGGSALVIMTATDGEKTAVLAAIEAGVNRYALKPFTPEGLTAIVEATLAKAA